MKQPYEWPSREQWAAQYPRPYWDSETDCPYDDRYSHKLSNYATPEEITALATALNALYRDLGRELKAANQRIKPANQQQRGEGHAAWYRRFRELPPEDKEPFIVAGRARGRRSEINDLLARIRNNEIPNQTRSSNYVPEEIGDLVAPINARYRAAGEAARDAYVAEYTAQHVPDDAAWERELERRAAIEHIHQRNIESLT
jgi:hypothetical protein